MQYSNSNSSSKSSLKETNILAKIGILCALSIGILLIPGGGWPIFPLTPWLKYDFVDVPIILGAFILGINPSMIILIIVSAFQSIFLSSDGWVGFVMHVLASGSLITIIYYGYKKFNSLKGLIFSTILSIFCMVIIMVILNLYFIPLVYPITFDQALFFLPWTIAFNLIKSSLNSTIAILIWKSILPSISKMKQKNI